MSKKQTVGSNDDLLSLRTKIEIAANHATENLRVLVETHEPLDVLRRMKFDECGADPLEAHPMNMIEQLNQTFTYLASLDGVAYLLARHANHVPFLLNLGTQSGYDIESEDGQVIAEVFAAVRPSNNGKLAKDSKRVHSAEARHKYVFFMSPGFAGEQESAYDDVRIVAVASGTGESNKAMRTERFADLHSLPAMAAREEFFAFAQEDMTSELRIRANQHYLLAITKLNECQAHLKVSGNRIPSTAQDGLEFLEEALRISPESSAYWNAKGLFLSDGLAEHQEALDCLNRALELEPDSIAIKQNIRDVEQQEQRTQKPKGCFGMLLVLAASALGVFAVYLILCVG